VIECKNANKDEAIALGVDQIRRYHRETPELFVSQQLFTATDAIGFAYGVSWNTVRRNIFNWKDSEVGKLEAKLKSFCAIPQLLAFLKDYIVFAEKDEELNKYILRQHQTGAVDASRQPCPRSPAHARPGLAYPGQRQDLHHDQGRPSGCSAHPARINPPCC
jgi:type I restriction enzyme R subunit